MTQQYAFYAAVGRRLKTFDVEPAAATLTLRSELELPEGLQYLCRHVSLPLLYAACSDGRPRRDGSRHVLCALRIQADGSLLREGRSLALPARPVHIATDSRSRFVFIVYPKPSRVEVYGLGADGRLGALVLQPMPSLRKTAHQIRLAPGDDVAIVPCRGNDASADSPEDPGAIEVLRHVDGQLTPWRTLEPDGGYDFGPRHVDFHPGKKWMYVSIERQNQLAMFDLDGEHQLRCRLTTLRDPGREKPRQLAGAIHVHPDGHTVYVSNRADGTVEIDGRAVFNGGENTIAVYRIDPSSGLPTLIQIADTHGIHPRTFQVHPEGGLLVSASMTPRWVRSGGRGVEVLAGLSVFTIAPDGTLEFRRKYDLDASQDHLFWAGFAALP